jgi:hypothetical protein
MTTDALPLAQVRQLLERAFSVGGGVLTISMREQIAALQGVGGPITMLALSIPSSSPQIDLPDGPYQGPHADSHIGVVDKAGNYIGGILLWIEAGRLSTLEYFWYTEDPPIELPPVERVVAHAVVR